MNRKTQNNNGQRGTAIVEAAIILLGFFVLLFGIMEAGRFLQTQQALTNAAREGARLAIAPLSGTDQLPSNAEIEARVNEFLEGSGVTAPVITITPVSVNTGPVTTTFTRVRVESTYQVLTMTLFDMLEVTLRGEALMRNETSD